MARVAARSPRLRQECTQCDLGLCSTQLAGLGPFGYHWKEKKLIPHPEEAPIRKRLYELYREHRRKGVVHPKTFGEHLQKRRIDSQLSRTKLASLLGGGLNVSTVEKWELGLYEPREPHRTRVLNFIGYDPKASKMTGGY